MPLTPFAAEVLSALYEAHQTIDGLRQRVAQLEAQQQAQPAPPSPEEVPATSG